MRGLNLGAGRAQFPTTRDNPFTSHVLWAIDCMCPEALDDRVEWVNTDRQPLPGVDRVVNLFRYPWMDANRLPFADNEFDIIWCGHIVEHIPHVIKLNHAGDKTLYDMAERDEDGWFAYHYECWRVLKPNGRLCILSPAGLSVGGMTDPTHTRYVMPGSFSYFQPNPEAPFDYRLPFAFVMDTEADGAPVGSLKLTDRAADVSHEMNALARNGANADSPEMKAAISKMEELTHHNVGYIDEIAYRFRKVDLGYPTP